MCSVAVLCSIYKFSKLGKCVSSKNDYRLAAKLSKLRQKRNRHCCSIIGHVARSVGNQDLPSTDGVSYFDKFGLTVTASGTSFLAYIIHATIMKLKNLHKTSIARVRSTEDATIQKLVPLNLQLPKLNQTNPFDSCETTLSYQNNNPPSPWPDFVQTFSVIHL